MRVVVMKFRRAGVYKPKMFNNRSQVMMTLILNLLSLVIWKKMKIRKIRNQ